jgi:GH15 family glucan-1,4-alpha-glucosidase
MEAPIQHRRYLPIGDYAAIGDCRTVALVARDGSIDWLCLPVASSPGLFAALLDHDNGGRFAINPSGPFTVHRRYLPDTNVLETTFAGGGGVVRLIDLMTVDPDPAGSELRPSREVLRIVEALEGEMTMRVLYQPRPGFGRSPPRLTRRGGLGWACSCHGEVVILHSDIEMAPTPDGGTLVGDFTLCQGERRALSLCYAGHDIAVVPPLGRWADHRSSQTQQFWRRWIEGCTYRGDHAEQVRRSLLAMKMLTYAPSGAVIAAATASLPEAVGADRNWDYRYCWLRDSSLTFRVFNDTGFPVEAASYLRWLVVATRVTAPRLQVVYDIYGRTDLTEKVLHGFEGWRGSTPVRIGNDAHRQLQLDLYGEAMATVADFVQRGNRIVPPYEARLVDGWGRTVCREWRRPDHGIWEVRTRPRHFTYSKAMCWTACERLAWMRDVGHLSGPTEELRRTQAAIAAEVEARAFDSDTNSYVAEFGGNEVDASLLLLPWFGFKEAGDPRMRGTLNRVLRELDRDGLLMRYPPGFDGFTSTEGAFVACGFWAVDCLARCGERAEAETRLRTLLGHANDVGLYSEEVDLATGELIGNFPQAFSHIGLVNAVMTMAEASNRRKRGDDDRRMRT